MQWSSLVNICDLIATFAFAMVGRPGCRCQRAWTGAGSSLSLGSFHPWLRNLPQSLLAPHQPAWVLNPWLFVAVLALTSYHCSKSSRPVGRFLLALDTFGLAVATVSSTNYAGFTQHRLWRSFRHHWGGCRRITT
jgi:uncharacterized membrane protein YeiH